MYGLFCLVRDKYLMAILNVYFDIKINIYHSKKQHLVASNQKQFFKIGIFQGVDAKNEFLQNVFLTKFNSK